MQYICGQEQNAFQNIKNKSGEQMATEEIQRTREEHIRNRLQKMRTMVQKGWSQDIEEW